MKKITFFKSVLIAVLLLSGAFILSAQTTINFDNASNWVQAGTTSLTSYGAHAYVESGVTIQGTNVLRETTTTQDGFPGFLGIYAMRVGNTAASKVAITIPTGGLANFSIKVRRWDNNPMPNYTVKYTTNGGTDWTSLTNIDGTLLTTSNFFTYNSGSINSSASNIIIEIQNTGTTERIMIDDFTWTGYSSSTTTVATPTFTPEAGTYTSAQNVSISTTTADASIYFTTNGDEPTESSTLYTTPVSVAVSTTLKAKAFKAGMDPSNTATAVYTINPTPTITVTEITIPPMSREVPSVDTETINITGTNLTEDITLTIDAIDGYDATVFGVTPTLPSSGGVATITFSPGRPGTYAATLKINSAGAAEVTRTINGTATLSTPVSTGATGVSSTGFTANWDIVEGASSYELNVYTKNVASITATDLFFSEYGEGSGGNKKYIELYNGTGSPVDLANYTIKKSTNGGGWATTYNFPTTTTIANNSTFVLANNSTDVIGATVYDVFANWNGDDAVGLFKNDVLIDVFGTPDLDPGTGWAIAGVENASVDHILIRKPTITTPTTDWSISSGTTEENSQWIVSSFVYNATNQTTDLGSHVMVGAGNTNLPIAGSPFTINLDTYKTLSGLIPETQYFYTVIAKYGSYSSAVSNEITVSTTKDTGIERTETNLNIFATTGKIHFNAIAGEKIEIYNAVGQRIVNTISTEGLNSLSIDAKGVLLVKVGERIGKVIL
jgi:hypothetical protein